jgi:hypothetical protein
MNPPHISLCFPNRYKDCQTLAMLEGFFFSSFDASLSAYELLLSIPCAAALFLFLFLFLFPLLATAKSPAQCRMREIKKIPYKQHALGVPSTPPYGHGAWCHGRCRRRRSVETAGSSRLGAGPAPDASSQLRGSGSMGGSCRRDAHRQTPSLNRLDNFRRGVARSRRDAWDSFGTWEQGRDIEGGT